jgi:hypothetical protein
MRFRSSGLAAWTLLTPVMIASAVSAQTKKPNILVIFGQQMWLLVAMQQKIKDFFSNFDQFPHQDGSSLNAGNIGYGTIKMQDALQRLKEVEKLSGPTN